MDWLLDSVIFAKPLRWARTVVIIRSQIMPTRAQRIHMATSWRSLMSFINAINTIAFQAPFCLLSFAPQRMGKEALSFQSTPNRA